MRILYISRATLYSNPGGDTTQITNTASALQKLGVEVDIKLTNEKIDYTLYDLVHFFNIIRPADILYHTQKFQKPYVVSTIFVDYREAEKYAFTGLRKIFFSFLPIDIVEYAKVLARYVVNKEKVLSRYYIFHGHRRSVKKVIANARLLLPNSHSEYARLSSHYKIQHPYKVIPNGIDRTLFSNKGSTNELRDRHLILCVARIEPLKNQLNLIRALHKTNFKLLLIGAPSVNQKGYYEKCRSEAGENVTFINHIPQKELIQFYKKAAVHVLPSWFETTGLSSLEAASLGCNIVITDKGDTREYFKDYAWYCDPASADSIAAAINKAAAAPINTALSNLVESNYTWEIAAKKTLESYNEILFQGK